MKLGFWILGCSLLVDGHVLNVARSTSYYLQLTIHDIRSNSRMRPVRVPQTRILFRDLDRIRDRCRCSSRNPDPNSLSYSFSRSILIAIIIPILIMSVRNPNPDLNRIRVQS